MSGGSPVATEAVNTSSAHEAMDRMYRFTRHVYDLSRKYYLLGRDRMLREIEWRPGDRVLEIGCGTARNLITLARLRPGVELYGLDASRQMLDTAEAALRRKELDDQITLRCELAENLDPQRTFGLGAPLDVIFFSYSLSMIPTWPQALEAARHHLAPGRTLYIVDFWDQSEWPAWFARLLTTWLKWFGVHHRPELLEYLRGWEQQGLGALELHSVARRYAYIAKFRKNG